MATTASDDVRPRLGVSSCLLGEPVRHDGGHKRDLYLLNTLGRWVDWVRVCPEAEMGLGVPRETLRLIGAVDSPRLVAPKSAIDRTDDMRRWSERRVEELRRLELHGYVLKRGSPSCGLLRVRVYDDHDVPHRKGRGLFAATLTGTLPLLPVEEEGRLHDPRLRENFIERVFAYHRWRRLLEDEPTPAGLVRFHTSQKLALMAHSPSHYQRLGRLVASAGTADWQELVTDYGRLLMESLAVPALPRRHVNVMHHILGFFKRSLDGDDRQELLELIESYRTGLVPLIVPLTLIQHHMRRQPIPDWLRDQVYLSPYPAELMLRNHV